MEPPDMTDKVRPVKAEELEKLLLLYRHLNPDDPELAIDDRLKQHWHGIMTDPALHYFVIEEDGMLVSSCNLTIIKNLTRSARPYGLIENVVTRTDYRNRGLGTAVLEKALQTARDKNCYKVMLMTGRKEENILRFYEKAGLHRGEKTGFIVRFGPGDKIKPD